MFESAFRVRQVSTQHRSIPEGEQDLRTFMLGLRTTEEAEGANGQQSLLPDSALATEDNMMSDPKFLKAPLEQRS